MTDELRTQVRKLELNLQSSRSDVTRSHDRCLELSRDCENRLTAFAKDMEERLAGHLREKDGRIGILSNEVSSLRTENKYLKSLDAIGKIADAIVLVAVSIGGGLVSFATDDRSLQIFGMVLLCGGCLFLFLNVTVGIKFRSEWSKLGRILLGSLAFAAIVGLAAVGYRAAKYFQRPTETGPAINQKIGSPTISPNPRLPTSRQSG